MLSFTLTKPSLTAAMLSWVPHVHGHWAVNLCDRFRSQLRTEAITLSRMMFSKPHMMTPRLGQAWRRQEPASRAGLHSDVWTRWRLRVRGLPSQTRPWAGTDLLVSFSYRLPHISSTFLGSRHR